MQAWTELLVLQPTSFCNIDCTYCYLPNRNKVVKFDLKLLEITLDNLRENNLIKNRLNILWHCGEPLTLPLLFFEEATAIIKKFSRNVDANITQSIQTNGMLITQPLCDFFIRESIKVGVSIVGPQFVHDKHRISRNGKGTFDQVIKGIDLLNANHIDFGAIAVLTKFALSYPTEIFNFFNEIGIKSIGFNIDEIGANYRHTTYSNSPTTRTDFVIF